MSRLVSVCVPLVLLTTLVIAQQPRLPNSISQGGNQGTGVGNVPVTSDDDPHKKELQAANEQRQAELKRDSEKMLELTQQLNEYLQKDNQNIMSLDAIKKAEQIEKLARSVKTKMKQVY